MMGKPWTGSCRQTVRQGVLVASTRLTIYLLRGVNDPIEALNSEKHPTAMALANGAEGTFFYEARPARAPSWVGYVQPLLEEQPRQLMTSSASGLLVLRAGDRYFALTFGYGRGFLDLSKIEHRFGLRVALNLIDPSQIRSLDTKTFEDMVLTRNTQVSKSAELPTFGVDISRDILRAVTGEPRDRTLAKRVSGSDALVLNVELGARDLPTLCTQLLAAHEMTTYRENFAWIDQLSLVDESAEVDALDALLVEQLQSGDTATTHMAAPEAIAWEDVDCFKIVGSRNVEYDDLDLDAYLAQLAGRTDAITIQALKQRRVSIRFSRSSDFDSRWTLYQCLISEQRRDGNLHALIEGRWFRVSSSLSDEVDAYARALQPSQVSLIESEPGEVEGTYNERLAESAGMLVLDAQIRRPGGASSGIELCDVLAPDGEFLHVKRKSRSSTLSHLFAQGSVAASTFLQDGSFSGRDPRRDHREGRRSVQRPMARFGADI